MSQYTIYAADKAGNTWTVHQITDPIITLDTLRRERVLFPHFIFGVYENDNPEKGDVEIELEEKGNGNDNRR